MMKNCGFVWEDESEWAQKLRGVRVNMAYVQIGLGLPVVWFCKELTSEIFRVFIHLNWE